MLGASSKTRQRGSVISWASSRVTQSSQQMMRSGFSLMSPMMVRVIDGFGASDDLEGRD